MVIHGDGGKALREPYFSAYTWIDTCTTLTHVFFAFVWLCVCVLCHISHEDAPPLYLGGRGGVGGGQGGGGVGWGVGGLSQVNHCNYE